MVGNIERILILVLSILIFNGCRKEQDPARYKGCVVVGKEVFGEFKIKLKLTEELREKAKEDYIWIATPKFEYDKLEIGDTIK